MNRVGFIGCGNMAKAMLRGIIAKKLRKPSEIIVSDIYAGVLEAFTQETGVRTTMDNHELVDNADVIFIAVKPQDYATTIAQIRDRVRPEQVIVTIAPGKALSWTEENFGRKVRIVRTMPNIPAQVGEGVTGVCRNEGVTDEDFDAVMELVGAFSEAIEVKESLMDVVCSVGGSAPAIVFMFIEALADAAVLDGMPRNLAYRFAAQMVIGSAHMVKDTGAHPGALKDVVCSPGGTTIEAVRVLEERGFRSSVIEAMHACTDKARKM